jgi:hypothetical protein
MGIRVFSGNERGLEVVRSVAGDFWPHLGYRFTNTLAIGLIPSTGDTDDNASEGRH